MRKHRELAEGAARLDFRLLGAPSARRDGEPLDLGSPQQQAILAVLLLHGDHAVSTQELIDAVWGEDSPPQALAALRTYVSRLRQALEPDRPSRAPAEFLISVPDGYALRLLPESLDVSVFEHRVADATAARAADRIARPVARLPARGSPRPLCREPAQAARRAAPGRPGDLVRG
jgi:DNA-binding SARP family transcriptional activator